MLTPLVTGVQLMSFERVQVDSSAYSEAFVDQLKMAEFVPGAMESSGPGAVTNVYM
jgi:hypothetical protein